MIVIVDSGGANIGSVQYALERMGKQACLTRDKKLIRSATHVILPGVGSAAHAMEKLRAFDLKDTLKTLTQPVLGICLGMQLLYDYSEEGEVQCLGIIPETIKKFNLKNNQAVPHMGWNTVNAVSSSDLLLPSTVSLLENLNKNNYFYFVHSYKAGISACTRGVTHYGERFSAVVQYKNYYGVQFHPERSGASGAQLLQNFLRLR